MQRVEGRQANLALKQAVLTVGRSPARADKHLKSTWLNSFLVHGLLFMSKAQYHLQSPLPSLCRLTLPHTSSHSATGDGEPHPQTVPEYPGACRTRVNTACWEPRLSGTNQSAHNWLERQLLDSVGRALCKEPINLCRT